MCLRQLINTQVRERDRVLTMLGEELSVYTAKETERNVQIGRKPAVWGF